MKKKVSDLAVFGGESAFEKPIPAGQMNLPQWERFEKAFRGIFERRYYTNQGPLVRQLEAHLSEMLSVSHVICVTNAAIALKIAVKALDLRGKVIVPALARAGTIESLSWAGIEPVACDVNLEGHHATKTYAEVVYDEGVCAMLGIHAWGNACDVDAFEAWAREKAIRLIFDASDAFGCTHRHMRLGGFGDIEILSFNKDKIVNGADGACICTSNHDLAARVRNIRSSYGAGELIPGILTSNGRMSEAQAAMALLSLEDYSSNQAMNEQRYECYQTLFGGLPGVALVLPKQGESHNYQSVVVQIDAESFGLTGDDLRVLLAAENIVCQAPLSPKGFRFPWCDSLSPEFRKTIPNTALILTSVLQMPSGRTVSRQMIHTIIDLFFFAHDNADAIRKRFRSEAI